MRGRKEKQVNPATGEVVQTTPGGAGKRKAKKYKTTQNGKKTGAAVFMIILTGIVIGGTAGIYKLDQQTIGICAYNKNLPAGHAISAEDIIEKQILKSEYNEMGNISLSLPRGETVQGSLYVPYARRDVVVGMNTVYSVNPGEAITPEQITNEAVDINPWYSSIEEGQEIFVMNFDSSDVYTRYLYPGAVLRLRAISGVPTSKVKEARNVVKQNEGKQRTENSFLNAVLPYTLLSEEPEDTTSYVAEKVFEGIRIVDAQNSNGSSIFDIYYKIAGMSASEKQTYIANNLEWLRGAIVPAKLVIVCSSEEADALAEYQQSPKTAYKYTVVKATHTDDEESDLYTRFADIANRIAKGG